MEVVLIALIVWVVVSLPIAIVAGSAMNVRKIRAARRRANQRNVIDLNDPFDLAPDTDAIELGDHSYRDEPCPTTPSPELGPPLPGSPPNAQRSPVGHDA